MDFVLIGRAGERVMLDMLLLATATVGAVLPSAWSFGATVATSAVWLTHLVITKPIPIPPAVDSGRVSDLERQLADLAKKVDSVSAAVNMRQLR